jgi:glycosyltransferase involved in cell wall biosynthesis
MKILLVNSSAYPAIGGVENSLRFMARELIELGHEVKIWCFHSDSKEKVSFFIENIEIVKYPIKPVRLPHKRHNENLKSAKEGLSEYIKHYLPDVIWSRSSIIGLGTILSGYEGPLFQIFCTNAKMDSQGLYLNTKGMPLKRRLLFLLLYPFHFFSIYNIEKKLIKNCHSVFFSENMQQQMQCLYSIENNSQNVIYPGVDINVFNRAKGKWFENDIKSKYKINNSKKIILYVGRLSAAKNLYLLIESFLMLKNTASLVIVGSGPEKERLFSYVKKKNLTSDIYFVGQQDEFLPGFYSLADATVLPTTIESFGQVFLESMACGTPVVGFGGKGFITATEEIVENKVTGYIVHKKSHKALAEGIEYILNLPPDEYKNMSELCIRQVKDKFSWKYFVKSMLKLLENYNRYE